jgi:hypothetical protein
MHASHYHVKMVANVDQQLVEDIFAHVDYSTLVKIVKHVMIIRNQKFNFNLFIFYAMKFLIGNFD